MKDLARSSLGKASLMNLDGGDPLEKLYGAVEVIIIITIKNIYKYMVFFLDL